MKNEELYTPDFTKIRDIEEKWNKLKPLTKEEIMNNHIKWLKTNIKIKQEEIKNMKEKIKYYKKAKFDTKTK